MSAATFLAGAARSGGDPESVLDTRAAGSRSALEAFLARDPAFRGIGTVRARRLASALGDGLHAALANRHPMVAEILGTEQADTLFAAYQEKLDEASIAAWLSELRVDPRLAAKIQRAWGRKAFAHLKRNPFLLVGWVGWRAIETIARRLGVAEDDPRRLAAAVETVLYRRLDQKHTLTSRSALRAEVGLLVGRASADKAIEFAIQDRGAEVFGDGVQPPGAAAMERFVARTIIDLQRRPPTFDLVAAEIEPDDLTRALNEHDARQPYRLTQAQRAAITAGLTKGVACLGGYAGSGKTTILKALCECAEKFGRSLHMMAVSGRAARRISEATGRPAKTIALFTKQLEDPRKHLGPGSIVVIDEASMVDLATIYRVLRRLGDASLILVGDPGQLPPIGFGLTFHALIDAAPTVILDRVHRQTAASGIPVVAEDIRLGRTPTLSRFDGLTAGVSFVECPPEEAIGQIERVGRCLAADGARRGDVQIIAPVKQGCAGRHAINQHFHALRSDDGRAHFPGRPDIGIGDPVVWTQNDYDRDLQNGSMGRVVSVDGRHDRAVIEFSGREFNLSAEDADRIELAYAISVHKAQGSQWHRVIVPVYGSRILDRTMLYTAVTRSVDQVILVGDLWAFEAAIAGRPLIAQRETSLGIRLRELAAPDAHKSETYTPLSGRA